MQQQEVELFHNYELRGWELSPRLYKIFGIAAAVHLFAFIVVSQVDLLGTKACDSPYIGKVCRVLDAAYVGSILLGTEMEFERRDYEKTEINPEDVTFIDVSEQFTYPAGYFAQANPAPEMYDPMIIPPSTTTDGSIPGFPGMTPSSPQTLDLNQPQVLPPANPNPVQGNIPDSPFSIGENTPPAAANPPVARNRTNRRTPRGKGSLSKPDVANVNTQTEDKNQTPDSNTTANKDDKQETDNKIDESKGFNPKPLEDWAMTNGEKILNKDVDVNAPFVIQVEARLSENGKLVTPKMTTTSDSDPKMTELAKQAILAFGDSQLLKPLYDVGGRNVKITFSQNKDNLQAIIQTETKSENEAKTLESGLNIYLKNFFKPKEGSDEQILMSKAQLGTNGRNFIINFLIPNDEKTQLIEKNLRSLQEKLKNKQSDSTSSETLGKDVRSAK